jgi:hypothetical protein
LVVVKLQLKHLAETLQHNQELELFKQLWLQVVVQVELKLVVAVELVDF